MSDLTDAQADYDAARAAYLRACEAEAYSTDTDAGSFSATRGNVDRLYDVMIRAKARLDRLQRGGIRRQGFVPRH